MHLDELSDLYKVIYIQHREGWVCSKSNNGPKKMTANPSGQVPVNHIFKVPRQSIARARSQFHPAKLGWCRNKLLVRGVGGVAGSISVVNHPKSVFQFDFRISQGRIQRGIQAQRGRR